MLSEYISSARIRNPVCCLVAVLVFTLGTFDAFAQKKTAKGKKDKFDDQYELVPGKFPAEGTARAISGELMEVDHLERRFQIRVDRNDSQDRSVWDCPLDAFMLPYGSIYYLGSPAALQDIPMGTHLHGLFYFRDRADVTPPPVTQNRRITPEIDFRRCFRLEDDFSFHTRQKQLWKVESVNPADRKLVAVLHRDGAPVGKPLTFDFTSAMIVKKGNGFATVDAIEPGQMVLFNLTWVTLYGPGRITEIWLDEQSRQLSMAQQLERHRNHIRERGLAGWVEAVDDEAQIVTITFFGGIDPKLFDELSLLPPDPPASATTKPVERPPGSKGSGGIAVARESLMTYDPVNDRKGGTILDITQVPVEPGSSGVQIRVKCDLLLEGFRPTKIVRFYPATWKVVALPREEQFFGRD